MTCHTKRNTEDVLTKTVISKEDGSRWELTLDLTSGVGRMTLASDADHGPRKLRSQSNIFELPKVQNLCFQ